MNFDPLITPIRNAWLERTGREQALLAGLGVFLLALIVWYGVMSPALNWRAEAERTHAAAVSDYERLLTDLDRYRTLAANADQPRSSTPLRTLVGSSANENQLAITRVQPLDDGGLSVWMDSVPADRLTAWLLALAREEGVIADRVSLDREGDGIVRAQLLLRRPGG